MRLHTSPSTLRPCVLSFVVPSQAANLGLRAAEPGDRALPLRALRTIGDFGTHLEPLEIRGRLTCFKSPITFDTCKRSGKSSKLLHVSRALPTYENHSG